MQPVRKEIVLLLDKLPVEGKEKGAVVGNLHVLYTVPGLVEF